MSETLSDTVTLPAKKGHAASFADVSWTDEDDGWTAVEQGTGRRTKKWHCEEEAIRAARRREWVK